MGEGFLDLPLGARLREEAAGSHGVEPLARVAEEERGRAVGEHLLELARRLARVERDRDRALAHDREVERHPARAVVAEERHAVARFHAGAAEEGATLGDHREEVAGPDGQGAFPHDRAVAALDEPAVDPLEEVQP